MSFEKILSDFILGGLMIAGVLAIASMIGPFSAGILAALPVRVWATLLLGGATGTDQFTLGMVKGIIPGSIGSLFFMLVLSGTAVKRGVRRSFILASAACIAATVISLAVIM